MITAKESGRKVVRGLPTVIDGCGDRYVGGEDNWPKLYYSLDEAVEAAARVGGVVVSVLWDNYWLSRGKTIPLEQVRVLIDWPREKAAYLRDQALRRGRRLAEMAADSAGGEIGPYRARQLAEWRSQNPELSAEVP